MSGTQAAPQPVSAGAPAPSAIPTAASTLAPTAVAAGGPPPSRSDSTAKDRDPKKGTPAETPKEEKPDEVKAVVQRLAQLASAMGSTQGGVAREINLLAKEAATPDKTGESVFRTRVAYAVQDVEKRVGPIDMSPELRNELQARARTYPGLENSRMQDLVAATEQILNQGTIRAIRSAAAQVTGRVDQNDAHAESIVGNTANAARINLQGPDLRPPVASTTAQAGISVSSPNSPRSEASASLEAQSGRNAGGTQAGRVVLDIMTALRRKEPETLAPWDRHLTPMGDRITAYTGRMREGAEEQQLRSAEKTGQAALAAMKDFAEGPGAVMMTRIRDAAKTDPNGITGVLAEMKDGGRYASLRQAVNVALQQEKGFAAAYEKAAGGVARFGAERVEVDRIASSRPDSSAISGRFQKLDAEIGKAASELPGKADGKSFTDELTARAGEIVKKAVEAVQTAFNRIRATASPSPGP